MLNSYNIYLNMQKLMNMGHSHPNIAFLYAFVGYGFLAFQQILTKYATVSLSSFQLLSIRSFLLIWFSLWVVQSVKCSPYVPSSQFFGLILRRIAVVAIAETLIFFCVTKIPISTVTTIFNTGPIFIFFVEALAYQKAIKRVNFILTIVSFTGVILIVQPDLIFGQNQRSVEGTGFYIGLMLLAALGSAINNHYIHKLAKNVHPYVNNFYSHMGHVVLNGIMNNLKPRSVPENFLTVNLVLIILGVSAATIVSQYGINLANSIKSPTLMMPFGYVGIVVGMCADVYLFGSQFDTLQCLGMFLTSCGLLSGYLVSFGSKEYSRL